MSELKRKLQARELWRGVAWLMGFAFIALPTVPSACGQELYPKPLVHTAADHPARRVLILNVEGMHAVDLAVWVDGHPGSALAELSRRGVTYTNAHVPWADPAAGLMAITTGGSPRSTGILTVDGYDHALSPPGSLCASRGTALPLDASMGEADRRLHGEHVPLDPNRGCSAVAPHSLLRVNTLFEVVHSRGGRTAWAGGSPAVIDLLRGPAGTGLDEACALDGRLGGGADSARIGAVVGWIEGRDCKGQPAPVPEIFGATLTGFDATERRGSAYLGYSGTPSASVEQALAVTDQQIGRVVAALKSERLYDTTWIVVAAAFGEGGISPQRSKPIDGAALARAIDAVQTELVLHVAAEGTAMIWLRDASKTALAVRGLSARAAELGIAAIRSGEELKLTMNAPAKDSRMPDILVEPRDSVYYSEQGVGVDGGDREAATHVPLLISGTQFTGRVDKTWVPTTQTAPLLMRGLGMDKFDLEALHHEHTPALPGIF